MKKFILSGHDPVVEPDLMKWTKWLETANRQVAKTEIGDVKISTVFLGLDHSFCGGVPVLFETMVFGGDLDGELDRYQTWDDAVEGHNRMVERSGKVVQVRKMTGLRQAAKQQAIVLTIIIVGIIGRGCYLEKRENYQSLWKKVSDLEHKCFDVPAAECRPSMGEQCQCE